MRGSWHSIWLAQRWFHSVGYLEPNETGHIMDGEKNSLPNSLMMETQPDDIEMVEEQCSVLISELGLARAKVDQAEQSLAGRVLPAFKLLVRHCANLQFQVWFLQVLLGCFQQSCFKIDVS